MIQRLYLMLKEFLSSKLMSLIVLIAVGISVFSVSVFYIIGEGFNRYIDTRFASAIPPNTLKVSPKPYRTVLFFDVRDPKAALLDEAALTKIRRLPGVAKIFPVMALKVPVQMQVSFSSFKYRIDAACTGVSPEYIEQDVTGADFKKLWARPDHEKLMPVIIPRLIYRAYTEGMAEQNGLPKLSETKAMELIKARLFIGQSSIRSLGSFTEVESVITGFTEKISALTIVMPLASVKYYNTKYLGREGSLEYLNLYVKAADHKSLLRLSRDIKKLGFVPETEKSLSEQILSLKKNVSLVIHALMTLILILAVIAVSFSTMIATMSRIEYYRILRIIGASKFFLTLSIVIKHLALGLIAAAISVYVLHHLAQQVVLYLKVSYLDISLKVSRELILTILAAGTIVPALSTIPALVRLYTKGLNRD